jgi:uncharacterized protein
MDGAGFALLTGGGALIGFLLSVLGAGGSILLLPLLVSGAALPTREAVPLSLLVVMLLALANLGPYLRRGQFALRPALILGLPALAGSWVGGGWVKAGLVPEAVQLGVFAAAALLASWLLTRRSSLGTGAATASRRGRPLLLAVQGVLVGLLTGIAGVGGGFAIVPALVLLAGLPMALASGTSLLLIAVNALVALAALGHWPATSLPLMLPLLIGGALGAVAGQRLAPHLNDQRLRQGFSLLLIGSALLSGAEAWRRHGSNGASASRSALNPAERRGGTGPLAPLGQVAEMVPRQGQQLALAGVGLIQGDHAHDPIQQGAVVAVQVVEQQLTHVALAGAVPQQQHRVGLLNRPNEATQVGVIQGGPLAGDVAVVAVAEVLAAAPEAVGAQLGVLHTVALQQEGVGVGVREIKHQPDGLVAPGPPGLGLGVIRAHAGGLQQVAHAHQGIGIEKGPAQAAAGVNPGFLAAGHLDAQAPAIEGRHRGAEAAQQGLHLGGAQVAVQGVGKQGCQRALVMTLDAGGGLGAVGHATAQGAEAVMASSAAGG